MTVLPRYTPTVMLAVVLVLISGLVWVESREVAKTRATAERVSHTYEVTAQIARILASVADVDSGVRAYLVTGDDTFLERFTAASTGSLDAEVRALCVLTSDNPQQRLNCAELSPLIQRRMAIAQTAVTRRRTQGLEPTGVAAAEARTVTTSVRAVLARMDAEERRLLQERNAAETRQARTTELVLIGTGAFVIVLVIGTFSAVIRENQLRQRTQEQLDHFFTMSLDMLCIADMQGFFRRVNPAFTATLGYNTRELLTRPFLDFVHPDDVAATVAEVEKLGQGVPAINFENRYRCADGTWRWLSWTTRPVPSEGMLYATARDVTDRKRADDEIAVLNAHLREQAAALRDSNKELETFCYSVSHDLRAPLRSIDGFSQVLLEDHHEQLDDDGKDALQRVRRAAATMGELIDALLSLSRVTRAERRIQRVDLSALAHAIAMQLREAQPERGADFVIASGVVVNGDPALLQALLTNLMGNAWKYSQPRAIARIEFGSVDQNGERVYFVRDNGVGFDMAYVDKLFGAFQRLHRATDFAGTGIGLATVQRIAHRHGGRAWAEGAVDKGATFYFTVSTHQEHTT